MLKIKNNFLNTFKFYFVPLVTEKVVLVSESLFQPANGVRSTRSLVEIHNRLEPAPQLLTVLKF